MTELVKIERDARVLSITLNRADKKNALTHAMYVAMADALELAHDDAQIRCVIISGAGDTFTAGNDLGDFAAGLPEGKAPVRRFLETILGCDKPIMAAVNGPAVGLGLTMLLHCDLAYASETATFRAPFPHIGVVPEAGSSLLLPAAVGIAWANDIFIAGRVLWDFENPGFLNLDGTQASREAVRGQVSAGLNLRNDQGAFGISATYDGLGTGGDFEAISGKLMFSLQF